MPAPPHPLRDHVLMLIRRGELATITEAAQLAAVTRQVMHRWTKAAGLDLTTCRGRYLARLRRRAERIEEGRPPRRRPSKAMLRAQGEKALRDWTARK